MAVHGMTERQHAMSKQRQPNQQQRPQIVTTSTPASEPAKPPVEVAAAPVVVETSTESVKTLAGQDMKAHRRCPLCWNRCKGYGTAYSTAPSGRTYYRCVQTLSDEPPCGHTWSCVIQLETIVVEHRVVNLDGMR